MRTWAIGGIVFIGLLSIPVYIEYRLSHPTVPPGVQRSECLVPPPKAETGNDRFARQGGRTTRYPGAHWTSEGYTVREIAQGRDLSRYDKLVLRDPDPHHFWEFRYNPTFAQARMFIWKHWQDRKRAYLKLTISGIDHTDTSHIFVEPDDSGRWRIYWRHLGPGELVDEPTAYSLMWAKPNGWDRPRSPLANGQAPDPIADELQLRDVCGEMDGVL